ncbi:MAG TPA: putative peptidoglycan glycosyltransferase FtsW [Streptosporangiaceae bacterium]|nr:putative peptidoglycan glycosyltransferase FtsW [Streptosporangiaceae bacterium]
MQHAQQAAGSRAAGSGPAPAAAPGDGTAGPADDPAGSAAVGRATHLRGARQREHGGSEHGGAQHGGAQHGGLLAVLDRPLTSYYLILGITTLLLALGLVMVLSTSSVAGLALGVSPYSGFQHQLLGVLIGLPCMWLAARSSPAVFRAIAYPLVFVAILGLLLVLGAQPQAGVSRWLSIAGFQFQPSELAKLAFLLWGADLLARKERLGQLGDWRHLLIPLLPGAGLLCMLVMLGDDLGTTFLLLVIFLALLWVIGTPARLYAGVLGMIGLVLLILIVVAGYRFERLTLFLHPQTSPNGLDMQSIQGKWAVGSGRWFGVGLGASRQKWGYVPNDTTDFIFAILGEELGLVGTLCVSLLYGGLAFAGLRIARRTSDTFVRLTATGATAWIVVQAIVNIGAVLGLLPITGVPLPLVSSGLSSLLVTMVTLGMLMSFAKREPGAGEALAAAGPGAARRALSWLGLDRRRE